MNIAIIGTGGVGGYFGARMAKGKNEVTFVARGQHFDAIKNKGLIVKSINGNFEISNAHVVDSISEIKNPDLIIVATKAWQVKDLAVEIYNIMLPNTLILPLQNGVNSYDDLATAIPKENIIPALCQIISKIEAPGIINHFGVEPTIIFGEKNNQLTDRVKSLETLLRDAQINSKLTTNIESEIWRKFILINSGGLLAVTRSSYGEIRTNKKTRPLIRAIFEEGYNVGIAAGVDLPENLVDKLMSFLDVFPYESTSSLSRDIIANKPSEINTKNGALVELGLKYNVPTPVNTFICACLDPIEKRARS